MSGFYTIPLSGLKEGRHSFDFVLNDKFFEKFEESEIKEGSLTAVVEADKVKSHIDLSISITGNVRIACDRCLGEFLQPVSCVNRLLVKFGQEEDEGDPDIVYLPSDESELDLQQYFYEYILLALPIQRVHPADRNGNSACDPEMLRKLQEHMAEDMGSNDPRWDELKKLMNKN